MEFEKLERELKQYDVSRSISYIKDDKDGVYTNCIIQFVDDGTEMDVIIQEYGNGNINDSEIFYYGLSRKDLLELCESGEVCEGEWKVISVGASWD